MKDKTKWSLDKMLENRNAEVFSLRQQLKEEKNRMIQFVAQVKEITEELFAISDEEKYYAIVNKLDELIKTTS